MRINIVLKYHVEGSQFENSFTQFYELKMKSILRNLYYFSDEDDVKINAYFSFRYKLQLR